METRVHRNNKEKAEGDTGGLSLVINALSFIYWPEPNPMRLSTLFHKFGNVFCTGSDRHSCLSRVDSFDGSNWPCGHVQARMPVPT